MNRKIILGKLLLIGIIILYFILLLVNGSATFADAMRGYEIMYQFNNGGEWNTLAYPHPENDLVSYFVAWWSPAQWLVPFFISSLTGIVSIQLIQAILIISCLLISLYGFKKLFHILGFKEHVVYVSLLCIVTNQLFYWHTFMYYGGDLLLLTFFPYFVLILIRLREYRLSIKWFILLIICFVGVFLKNTFLVLILCAISFEFFRGMNISFSKRIRNTLPLIVSFTVVYFIVHYFLLSKGSTPASSFDIQGYSGVKNSLLNDISFALGSPVGILTRFSFFIQKSAQYFSQWETYLNLLQFIPLLLTFIFLYDYKKFNDHLYSKLLIFFGIPFLCFFMIMYFQDRAISYEMRHFSAIAFLFIPGIIRWISSLKGKNIWYTLIVIFCLVDFGMFFKSTQTINKTHSFWNTFKLPNEDVEILNSIESWDQKTDNGLLLIEDYWQLNIGARKNHKIVFQQKENSTIIMSGIELNNPDKIDINKDFFKKYDEVLLVLSRNNSLNFLHDKSNYKVIKNTENFQIVLIRNNN